MKTVWREKRRMDGRGVGGVGRGGKGTYGMCALVRPLVRFLITYARYVEWEPRDAVWYNFLPAAFFSSAPTTRFLSYTLSVFRQNSPRFGYELHDKQDLQQIERHRNDRTCPLYEYLIKRFPDVKLNVKLCDIDFITITVISNISTDNSKQNGGLILFDYLTNETFPFCWNFRTQRYFDTSQDFCKWNFYFHERWSSSKLYKFTCEYVHVYTYRCAQ